MSPVAADRPLWFDRSARVRVEVAGPDRAKFLHNLTTNDVKRLAVGSGQESFVTSPQGKTLAYVTLLATDRAILVRSDPGAADAFLPHLAKYGVFDDIAIEDLAPTTCEFHLAGPDLDAALGALGADPGAIGEPLQHREVVVAGFPVRLVRESLLGVPGWTLIGPAAASAALVAAWTAAGIVAGDEATFEARRIEAGTPASGLDVGANNLPQEVGRDARTINFVKGCYLGQETVARLDALGHVNRILRGGHLEGTAEVPPPGTPLVDADGKPAGTITSAAFSAGRGAPVFLAYVRVAHAAGGTRLGIPAATPAGSGAAVAVVADLPSPG